MLDCEDPTLNMSLTCNLILSQLYFVFVKCVICPGFERTRQQFPGMMELVTLITSEWKAFDWCRC